jgi:hypothetical protein
MTLDPSFQTFQFRFVASVIATDAKNHATG